MGHSIAQPELIASFDILRHIALADGSLSLGEARELEVAARRAGVPFVKKPPREPVESIASRMHDPELRESTLRAGIALANIDGCTVAEHQALERIATAFGLPVPMTLGRVAVPPTEELVAKKAAANDRFLSRVSAATQRGELTQQRYDALVAELEAEIARFVA
jgi:hypothetical protein